MEFISEMGSKVDIFKFFISLLRFFLVLDNFFFHYNLDFSIGFFFSEKTFIFVRKTSFLAWILDLFWLKKITVPLFRKNKKVHFYITITMSDISR